MTPSLSAPTRETQKNLEQERKHATIAIYTACFYSLLCVSTQFPASSAPSWWYYLSLFLLHRHDEGCIKLAAWQGERVRGQHRGPCFKKKSLDTLSLSSAPPMSPSHNTESDIESRGLLFKIAAHRHSSEDLNNQLWKGKKKEKKKAECKIINWDPTRFHVLVLSWISPTRNQLWIKFILRLGWYIPLHNIYRLISPYYWCISISTLQTHCAT